MPIHDFVNGYGLAERMQIGPKELATLSLFLDIKKKDQNNQHIGTLKDDVSILTNKLSGQPMELK